MYPTKGPISSGIYSANDPISSTSKITTFQATFGLMTSVLRTRTREKTTLNMQIAMMIRIDFPMTPIMDPSEQLSLRRKLTSSREVRPGWQALPGRSRPPRLCCLLPFCFVCYFLCFC